MNIIEIKATRIGIIIAAITPALSPVCFLKNILLFEILFSILIIELVLLSKLIINISLPSIKDIPLCKSISIDLFALQFNIYFSPPISSITQSTSVTDFSPDWRLNFKLKFLFSILGWMPFITPVILNINFSWIL